MLTAKMLPVPGRTRSATIGGVSGGPAGSVVGTFGCPGRRRFPAARPIGSGRAEFYPDEIRARLDRSQRGGSRIASRPTVGQPASRRGVARRSGPRTGRTGSSGYVRVLRPGDAASRPASASGHACHGTGTGDLAAPRRSAGSVRLVIPVASSVVSAGARQGPATTPVSRCRSSISSGTRGSPQRARRRPRPSPQSAARRHSAPVSRSRGNERRWRATRVRSPACSRFSWNRRSPAPCPRRATGPRECRGA